MGGSNVATPLSWPFTFFFCGNYALSFSLFVVCVMTLIVTFFESKKPTLIIIGQSIIQLLGFASLGLACLCTFLFLFFFFFFPSPLVIDLQI